MVSGGGMSGGLAGLVNAFNQKGHGDVVKSWVANGQNLPILAAQILPHLVDKATPNGQVPSAGGLMDAISGIFRKT